jgi:hypothetical protein
MREEEGSERLKQKKIKNCRGKWERERGRTKKKIGKREG